MFDAHFINTSFMILYIFTMKCVMFKRVFEMTAMKL